MAGPIPSVGGSPGPRRVRGRRAAADAAPRPDGVEEPAATEAAAAVPPLDARSGEAPAALSAHLMGQSAPAEGAAQADSAHRARSAYLKVEWSGRHDRRTRRGRIARTEV